jgi:hypothetical protein
MAATTRTQIITYVTPALRTQLEQDRQRLWIKHGHRMTVSAYVESVLRKHLAKRTILRREVGLEKRTTSTRR